ncbi:MAG: TIGR03435 family protein [Bryobacteraceae bacterium]
MRPRFEVASVKRNMSCGGRRGGGGALTPGRLNMECATLQTLIENAYYIFADGVSMNRKSIGIAGGPSWILSDTYDISAKAEDSAPFAKMAGPMMQALLEERFKLELRHQFKEGPVYILTVANSGSKLESTTEGSCVTVDINHPFITVPNQPRPVRCGSQGTSFKDGIVTMSWRGTTMDLLANDFALTRVVGRPIIDRTGLSGQFDIRLAFAPDTSAPVVSGEASAPGTAGVPAPGEALGELETRRLFGVLTYAR